MTARIPLTESQREVWLATQMQPEANLAYTEGLSVTLRGELQVDALCHALQALVERHDILRATISPDGRWLSVQTQLQLELPVVNCTGVQSTQQRLAVEADEMGRPFDLERGPLIRFRLAQVSPSENYLLIIAHHIVVDGWSVAVLLTELGALYSAFVRNEAAQLPPAPHYGDYVDAEKNFIGSATGTAHSDFWLRMLQDAPPPPQLPLDRPRPLQRTYSANRIDYPLDRALVQDLRRLGAAHDASLVATTLAAFAVLLHRITAADDFVIGLAASGQSFHGYEQLVGHCVNFLPLRFKPDANQPFSTFLRSAQSGLLDAFEHQGATFGTLLPKLKFKRDPQRPPLISVAFNLDVRDDKLSYLGLEVSYTTLIRRSETFELYLNLVSEGEDLLVECSYNADLFSAGMITARLEEFATLLRSVCGNADRRLDALPILSVERREQIAVQWNATRREYPPDATVHGLIAAAVARWPDEVAVVAEGGTLTYRQLDQLATAVAEDLHARGVGPDVIVGVCAHRSLEMVVALLGILKAGGAYLPLDPEYPAERLSLMVEDAGCHLILAGAALEATAAQCIGNRQCEVLSMAGFRALPASSAAGLPVTPPDSLVYVIFTSGSTGRPKGTLLTHRGVVNRLLWGQERYPIGPGDRLLQKTPYSFDVSVPELFAPLMTGATLVMARPEGHKDPAYLVDIIQRERISSCHFVPSMLGPFLDQPQAAQCRSLRMVFASGEALPYSLTRRFLTVLPQVGLHDLYGPTEASVEVSYWDCPPEPDPRQLVPIGRPVANTQLYVLDAAAQPTPIGVSGDLYIGGVQLARGYLNRPELTAERFITHPEFGRLYRTGDLARWLPDGVVDFLGRADGQVKLRGFRIELGEVEAQLRQQPAISEAVVALRERAPGDQRLIAWVAPRPGQVCDPDQMSEALARVLPDYMIPQVFVSVADFPRLISGKISHAALPDPFANLAASRTELPAPRTDQERALASLWQEILGIGEVSRDDRFLDLGGHSLLAVRMAANIEQRFAIRLPLRAVMMDSLAGLARQLPGGDQSNRAAAVGAWSSPPAIRQQAFFFGNPNRQLFGVAKLPVGQRKRTAVLICTSWGAEYMRAYRALGLFAEQLSQEGFPVLRFDYAATGDSAGYSVEANLEEWIDNISTAAAELKQRSSAEQVCIIGLRLGGLLAERAVANGLKVAKLVLWDPPADGGSWLASLREFDRVSHEKLNNQRARHVRLPPLPTNQLLGMPLTDDFQRAIESLRLGPDTAATGRLLVISADGERLVGASDVLQLPTPSHWSNLSWIYTPWNPGAASQIVVRKLTEQLP